MSEMLFVVIAALASLEVGLAGAAPIYDFDIAKAATIYSTAAYCLDNNTDWSCHYCKDPLVANFKLRFNITNKKTDMHGFAGVDETRDLLVISFRGTEDLQNWITNLNGITKADWNLTSCNQTVTTAQVHLGFYEAWNSIKSQVINALQQLQREYPSYKLLITGHSLGAALSTLAALDILCFVTPSTRPMLYNFGSPRLGNDDFVKVIDESNLDLFRHTHWKDVVPHLPPDGVILGYHHAMTEYFLPHVWEGARPKQCDGSGEDPTCADQFENPFEWSADDHLLYFNYTMGHDSC